MYAIILVTIFLISLLYTYFRGKERLKLSRQLFDHSTFLGPINMFMTGFSRLPAQPFYAVEDFPELKPLQDNWQIIRDEAVALQNQIKAAQSNNDAGFNTFFKRGWKRFYLKWYQDSHPSAQQLCPKTVAILEKIPSVKAAMFAELPSGSYLGKHRDPYAGSVRYHLGLSTPNSDDCFIEVDQQRYSWRDGQATIFDETYVHWAQNKADQTRIILFCDIERPMKWQWAQNFNHWFGRNVMSASASPNDAQDQTGFINRIFKYFYAIHAKGRELKAKNRKMYYLSKWALFLALISAILLPSVL
ncbi:lipid A hydroxylase LpxO [Acinetobacter sp. ME22]|uniref:lipid A hydroxylase LpxO n=1 Tax=Acinetobacter sp. ME22 TaxID=2904802 RepID=UPI001EDA1CB1|nr:lipid A hydroxylase LpxO [Acinetobacter sp. ME22]MCG2574309.1 lipid A hydroxylase LpxO [Acinetobacter sp. ME22]